MSEIVVQNLRELRGVKTQDEFARELGVSLSYYSKLELGLRKPSRKVLESLKSKFPTVDMNIFFTKELHV